MERLNKAALFLQIGLAETAHLKSLSRFRVRDVGEEVS
jgi:hypothetical protein